MQAQETVSSGMRPPVLLIHGYAGHRMLWWRFVRGLRSAGFAPKPWGYRSVWSSIETFSRRLSTEIQNLESDSTIETYHVVTHSMGGILLRTMLANRERPIRKLQRIVMLCPPNRGSPVARRVGRLAAWFSPSLPQISDSAASFVNQLPKDVAMTREVGIVVAQGDLVVEPESTQLPGITDTCEVPGMHSAVLMRKETIDQTIAFLRNGRFVHPRGSRT